MSDSSTIGARFEEASRKLFNQLFPQLGFEVIKTESRISGSQSGYDIRFETKPLGTYGIRVNFFVECKGAKEINRLTTSEYDGKPEQLHKSTFNPDYWILFSPLRYKNNDFQELLEIWKKTYPFAFVDWVREIKEDEKAGLYIDLFKHFPDIYEIFKEDVPENVRDTPPEYELEEILARLKKDINEAYDEYQNRVNKGLLQGIKRITPQAVYKTIESDITKLNKIRSNYYMLNSSDKSVWRTVCNKMDVRNTTFQIEITGAIENNDDAINTIWVLGASGCGKTTQMYRTAVNSAINEYPVILINSLNLDETPSFEKYEEYFRLIHHLHNVCFEKDQTKPLLIFIDNPAARIEDISKLLGRFDDLDEDDFKCKFILFEREIRYRQAEEDNFLIDIAESHSEKIYIETENTSFKENVLESFAQALNLPADEFAIAQEAFFENQHTTIAEGIINYCKKTNNEEYKKIVMDWVDFEDIARRQQWNSLTDLYKWTSLLYQFGVVLPVSLLKKIINFDKTEFYNLEDFFGKEEFENLPLILEGNTLRTRHELIAGWYVDEKLRTTLFSRLGEILKAVDVQDALERSIYIALFGRKYNVRDYIARLESKDFEEIFKNASEYPLTQKLTMMAKGWIYSFGNEVEKAIKIFKSVLDNYPQYLPAILETGKAEFYLGNAFEAEQRFLRYLDLDSKGLHPRTELGKVYQALERYDEAEKRLLEYLELDPKGLQPRTELGKVYQALGRYDEAERILLDLLELDKNNLQARTELGKVYQALGRYDEAERILLDLLELDKNSLQVRTELGKVYQALERYDEAEKTLLQCIGISLRDLNSRNELARFYRSRKNFEQAEKLLKECISISPKDLNSRTELAKLYQVQGKYDDAINTLEDLLNNDPQNILARTELGKVYQALGRYDEAEKTLLQCIGISLRDLNSRTELGKVYQALGRYDEAEKILLESIEIDNSQLHPRTELGKVYQALERYDEAEKILLEALAINDKQLQPRTELGKVYQALGRYDEAERILLEALAINDKQLQPRTELGKVYQALGRYDEAERILLDLLELDKNNLQARTELGKVYQALERYDEAERILLEALKINDKQLHSRTELARVYVNMGLFRKARAEILEFLQNNPESNYGEIDYQLLVYLNSCYRMKRYQDGISLVDKYSCQFISPQLAEEYGRLLRNYDLPNAVKFFQTASRIFSKSSRLLSEAAICLKLGGKDEAESILETAIRLEPKKVEKYRDLYENAHLFRPTHFKHLDCKGIIISINYERMDGIVGNKTESYSFRWNNRLNLLYSKLKVNDEVYFDISDRGYAINIEPIF